MANLKLSWMNVPLATSYDVMLNGEIILVGVPAELGDTTHVYLSGLEEGSYEVLVIAKDFEGEESEPSNSLTFSVYGPTFPILPPDVVLVAQAPDDYRIADLVFNNVVSVDHYDIYVDGKLSIGKVAPESGDLTTVRLVVPPGDHVVEVVAVSAGGMRSQRTVPAAFSMVVPEEAKKPPFLRAGVLNGRDIRLLWYRVPNAAAYEVFLNGKLRATVPDNGSGTNFYDLLDRLDGTYDFHVVAVIPMVGKTVPSNAVRVIIPLEG